MTSAVDGLGVHAAPGASAGSIAQRRPQSRESNFQLALVRFLRRDLLEPEPGGDDDASRGMSC